MLLIIWGSWIRYIKRKKKKKKKQQIPADIKHQGCCCFFLFKEWNRGFTSVYEPVKLFRFPRFYCVDCFVSFVSRHPWVLQALTPSMSRNRFQAQKVGGGGENLGRRLVYKRMLRTTQRHQILQTAWQRYYRWHPKTGRGLSWTHASWQNHWRRQ